MSRRVRVLLASGAVAIAAALVAVVVVRAGDAAPADPADPAGAAGRSAVGSSSPVPPADGGSPALEGAPPAGTPAAVSADAGALAVEASLAGLAPPTTVRYTFDAGPGRAVVDTDGRSALRPVVAGGGAVSFARRGGGYAVRFPARCRTAPASCPRAILESTRSDLFNAGVRPIRFGATLLMTPADTGPGANVLQKGFSVGGGTQFKLQVDGRAGRPSCVLSSGRAIYRLVAPDGVADGRWHNVVCTRVGGRMTIEVDGVAVSRRLPPTLSIRNSEPLRVGGKGTGPGNDQFAGRIDEVFISLY